MAMLKGLGTDVPVTVDSTASDRLRRRLRLPSPLRRLSVRRRSTNDQAGALTAYSAKNATARRFAVSSGKPSSAKMRQAVVTMIA